MAAIIRQAGVHIYRRHSKTPDSSFHVFATIVEGQEEVFGAFVRRLLRKQKLEERCAKLGIIKIDVEVSVFDRANKATVVVTHLSAWTHARPKLISHKSYLLGKL